MKAKIVLLPGDGIGPEVVEEGQKLLLAVAQKLGHQFSFETHLIGGIAIDQKNDPLPEATLEACKKADAVLLGAVGGPKWDQGKLRPEQGLLKLRKSLGLYANLRPVRPFPELIGSSPLRPERLEGADLLVVRELTGGLYFGARGRDEKNGEVRAFDTMEYSVSEIERVVRTAFVIARGRRKLVTSVDKANVLESSKLWREVTIRIAADYPDVKLEHQLVDSAAMRLVTHPSSFDVLVTENMFGDILSDEASVLTGSLGMLPSASLAAGKLGLYEPVHGSAPDIAGQGIANPIGTLLSAAMLLRHSLDLGPAADAIERAVAEVLREGGRTRDLGTPAIGTQEMGKRIREKVEHVIAL